MNRSATHASTQEMQKLAIKTVKVINEGYCDITEIKTVGEFMEGYFNKITKPVGSNKHLLESHIVRVSSINSKK